MPAPLEQILSLQSYLGLPQAAKPAAARKIIAEAIIDAVIDHSDELLSAAILESDKTLPGYATLDDDHRQEIHDLREMITKYIPDTGRVRPLNILMLASPGAGKSYFIKQIARALESNVQAVTFNMATMQSADDLAQPVDAVRNLKVNDEFPLLFIDEFDSSPANYPTLLPLLWDGELRTGQRELKLGRLVIILAGSSPDIPKVMEHAARMQLKSEGETAYLPTGKLVDLLSRINGGTISIPDLDMRTSKRDRRIDKVCVTISMIKGRFRERVYRVPRSLLRFVAHTSFRYGARSIFYLVDSIPANAPQDGILNLTLDSLPMASEEELQKSSLRLHFLDQDDGFGIVNRWEKFAQDNRYISLLGEIVD